MKCCLIEYICSVAFSTYAILSFQESSTEKGHARQAFLSSVPFFPLLPFPSLLEMHTKEKITCSKVSSCSEVWPFLPTVLLFSGNCDQSHFGERKFSRGVSRRGGGKNILIQCRNKKHIDWKS